MTRRIHLAPIRGLRGLVALAGIMLGAAGCLNRFATDEDGGSSIGQSTAGSSSAESSSGSPTTMSVDSTAATGDMQADWALAFDGTSSGVTLPLPGLPAEYTVEFWVRSDGALHGVLASAWGGEPRTGWYFFQEEGEWTAFDNVLVFIDYSAPDWYYVVDPALDLNDQPGWRHVAATRNVGGLVRLFVDGEAVAEQQFTTPFAIVDRPLHLGRSPEAAYPLFGAVIDDLRISRIVRYADAFTPQADPPADTDTLYLWRLDEADGAQAFDAVQGTVLSLIDPVWVEGVGP